MTLRDLGEEETDPLAALSRMPLPDITRMSIDPDRVEQDLARLVLGLMEFLRQLMELQAVRRMEAGSLTEDEEERLGLTLMRAEEALHRLADEFGLTPEDLSLDLGPLGRTV